MEHTGHHSNAVRSYKRTSNGQMRDVSNILYGQGKPQDPELPPSKRSCIESESSCKENPVTVHINNNSKEQVKSKDDSRNICVNVNLNFSN